MPELRIAYVDHYVAKPAIQKLARLRADYPHLDEALSEERPLILEVMIAEAGRVGGRPHYDNIGCVGDMTSHLMQVIAHAVTGLAIRQPAAMRAARRAALLALFPAGTEPGEKPVLGQYVGYAEEPGVALGSVTPTFFSASAGLDLNKLPFWPSPTVPTLRLGSGKALAERRAHVEVLCTGALTLTIELQPKPRLTLVTRGGVLIDEPLIEERHGGSDYANVLTYLLKSNLEPFLDPVEVSATQAFTAGLSSACNGQPVHRYPCGTAWTSLCATTAPATTG
jgi:glucose-6-phosphate 1-dehydrogenase